MNSQPPKVKDAPEEWIVKYRAAMDSDPTPQTRTSRLLAVLDHASSTMVSKMAKFVDDWIHAYPIPVEAPVHSATVTNSAVPTTLQNGRRNPRAEKTVIKKAG